jgi:cytochrome c oxidase assembly protein subunit 15
MNTGLVNSAQRSVSNWLLTGVGMIMVQVVLGGITRLTGSGLSITEWQPILGALPPMNEAQWEQAFEKYKQIGQYKQINFYFTLSDFKFIYFWEWFHRLWARLLAVVFAVPFLYFLLKGYFKRSMIFPLVMLFLLGGVQGALGWIMVKSGLNEENIYVSHFRLAIHFMAALGLLAYTLWFALRLRIPDMQRMKGGRLRYFSLLILFLLLVQLVFGAFMAGLKAAVAAPTWPMINDVWIPDVSESNWSRDPLFIQFIHRGLAYLLTFGIIIWWWRIRKSSITPYLKHFHSVPLFLVLAQILLGIFTVLYSTQREALIWLGTAHQFIAMLLLASWIVIIYLLSYRPENVRG